MSMMSLSPNMVLQNIQIILAKASGNFFAVPLAEASGN